MSLAASTAPMQTIDSTQLTKLGEMFAAGFFEEPEAPPVARMARGLRRHLEQLPAPKWEGAPLYPAGGFDTWNGNAAVRFHYSHSLCYNPAVLKKLRTRYPESRETLDALDHIMAAYPKVGSQVDPEFWLGGDGYTHSIPNFGRICREGLDRHAERVAAHLDDARKRDAGDQVHFYAAMEDLLAGIRTWHGRCLGAIRAANISSPEEEAARQRLLAALRHVPFRPARSFYEGLVATNFIFYLDGCDSLGRFDQDLGPFYAADVAKELISADQAVPLVRLLWENVDANSAWNVALGGSTSEGDPAFNGLTRVCLQAAHAIRRPNLALRLRRDAPDEILDDALDAIASGCGIPALYNEEGYRQALSAAGLGLSSEDLADFAFGGCTETMVHGKSNVGSLDAGINLPQLLVKTLDARLVSASDFASLFDAYKDDLRQAIERLTESVSRDQEQKARFQPQPLRSLLIDDCIDEGVEYNVGGARYNWSVINIGGLANVIDSLAAVRELVYEQRQISAAELLEALRADFVGYELLHRRLENCPRFGNDQPEADALAEELSTFVFEEFGRHVPWRGGRFLPGCLMFVTYAGAGEKVAATPDGRRAGAPIADSAGPFQGRDRSGPTAMLRSVTRIAHHLAPGTLVVNTRFSRESFDVPQQRARLKELIRTYFDLGGMQLQINVVDQEVLQDAIVHPENHQDLIVRVGGYSEYFNRLSPALKQSILERTIYS
jgi:pyruvate-formate lyase